MGRGSYVNRGMYTNRRERMVYLSVRGAVSSYRDELHTGRKPKPDKYKEKRRK